MNQPEKQPDQPEKQPKAKPAKQPRSIRTDAQRLAAARDQVAHLEAKLAREKRKADTTRKVLLGSAALLEMAENKDLRTKLVARLTSRDQERLAEAEATIAGTA